MATKVKIQKLSLRLLRMGCEPEDAVRDGVQLMEWDRIKGAKIAVDKMGGKVPQWARFLKLTDDMTEQLRSIIPYGLVFIPSGERWFAASFGMGHVKLDPSKFEHDFGLRVVLNAVDPNQLKSFDIRTPDENTLTRRSQTSRASDQTAFGIDIERDIIRGVAGTPKDPSFASRVSGADALSMDRRMEIDDLPAVCAEVYSVYRSTDYQSHFGWIDQVRHVRDGKTIEELTAKLVDALDLAVKGGPSEFLYLAFPEVYDPDRASFIRYAGFESTRVYQDLDVRDYISALQKSGKTTFTVADLRSHSVHEADEDGHDIGRKWPIRDCLVFETELRDHTYVLSAGLWYQVDRNLAREVKEFFTRAPRFDDMPPALAGENEKKYNDRVAGLPCNLLSLDRKLVRPSGATSNVEVCDFLSADRHLIHVKDKTSSSKLSHLFNQGLVSARLLKMDEKFRSKFRNVIAKAQTEFGKTGYVELVPSKSKPFNAAEFTVVYAVLDKGAEARLPFFSLVAFRQAARELQALGFNYAFAWIRTPGRDERE